MRERIGPYRIDKKVLGVGGMGRVYKGRHETLHRDAAIKTLLPSDAGDAALRQRLLREAQAQARLQHPNIVAVYDFIDEQGELFIAMEYVDGETLAALLERRPRGRMPLEEALPLFEQVLDALEYVHGEQIVHRDVKPSNVMVCGGRVKLADFGIALLGEMPRITASLRLIGSPPYMSPEQLEAKSIDHRSDIYSAALVLYRMLAGRCAFEAKEYLAQVHERLAGAPSLRALVPELPGGLCDAVAVALRYERDERFRSAAAFRDALHEGAAGFLVPAEPLEETVVAEELTEPAERVPRPEPPKTSALALIAIAGAFVASASVLIRQIDRQAFPVKVPVRTSAVDTAAPLPIIIETTAPPVAQPNAQPRTPTVEAAEAQPPKVEPFATASAAPAEDEEEKRRHQLEALRDAIRRGLARAEEALVIDDFSSAFSELDRAGEMAQRDAANLAGERDQIAQMRERVTDAQVAAQTRKAENALWASRLAAVEDDLHAERWPEAERFASDIVRDPRAPEPVAARARELLQLAKDGRRNAFSGIQLGPTTNTIRKPSSPPRKEL